MKEPTDFPILYSLRNCPYAMRARFGIFKSKQQVILRDIVLSNKPDEMIAASAKGEVPTLVVSPSLVIDQSLEVMLWALRMSDPNDLLHSDDEAVLAEMLKLIASFDIGFKLAFDKYSAAKRYHDENLAQYRQGCEVYINDLEQRLNKHAYIMSEKESLADIALISFIRKFARVERKWYLQAPYPKVRSWLNSYLQSALFSKVMKEYPLWLESKEVIIFGDK